MVGQYQTVYKYGKKTVNCRRINKDLRRHKLAMASFISMPRLVKVTK